MGLSLKGNLEWLGCGSGSYGLIQLRQPLMAFLGTESEL